MKIRKIIIYSVLVFVSVICLFWIYTLFINATRSGSDMRGIKLVPSKYLFVNLGNLLTSSLPVLNSIKNSFIVSTVCAFGCVYFASLCAYGFHMYDFKCKKVLFLFLMIVMMVPPQVGILGYVDLARKIGLTDSLWSIIFPRMSVPVTFYYIYQFMKVEVSKTYIEAARIDGAGELVTFHKIIFPMLKSALVVQLVFEFVYNWNSLFVPAVMLSSDKKKTLAIVVAFLRSMDDGMLYAMMALAIIPIVLVYLVLSKQIISGITAGGIKE